VDRPPSSQPSRERGTIEDVQLDELARPQLNISTWDLALIGIFAVALGGGVILGVANLLGDGEGSAAQAAATPTATDSLAGSPSLTPLHGPSGFATPLPEVTMPPPPAISWQATAELHRGRNGERFTYECPPEGSPAVLWGTRIYTDDSSVCTAGVHLGLISLASGGTLTIEMRPGRDSYPGSRMNGIDSQGWPRRWHGSFVFVD